MSNNLVVGSIQSNVTPPLTGGIYEALLEKAERERDEARKELEEQCRLLGMGSEREARLITERDEARKELEEQCRLLGKAIKAWADKKLKEI